MDISKVSQERFLKAKKYITKIFPHSSTKANQNNQYWVEDGEGHDICNLQIKKTIDNFKFNLNGNYEYELRKFENALNNEPLIPKSNSVKEAWIKAEQVYRTNQILQRNSDKFSDDKVNNKMRYE